jgi:nitroreductase
MTASQESPTLSADLTAAAAAVEHRQPSRTRAGGIKRIKALIQELLGAAPIRYSIRTFQRYNAAIFSSTYLASIPYHWISFFGFMREQRAVLTGKKNYYRNLGRPGASRVDLRRNTHRLEKGLLMKPLRDVFAQNYIIETVASYKAAVEQYYADTQSLDYSELVWAHNVLAQFFAVTHPVGTIQKARAIFEALPFHPEENDKVPYHKVVRGVLPSYEQLLNLAMTRRSVRWFLQQPVPRDDIDKALLVARQSPTACNRLPYEFRIFDEPELVKKVANTPFGTTGYADNIPVIAVLVGKLDSYFSARDRHAIYVDSALAAMSFTFALETQGISSCMINWPDFEPLEMKMQKLLGLSFSERPIMLIAIGYADPDGKVAYSQKKSLENIRSFNKAPRP